jgi:hypothetical protein
MIETASALHSRRRRHPAHHRTRSQGSTHRLEAHRPNHRRQAAPRQQWRTHWPDLYRTLPQPRNAKKQEAKRAWRFRRRRTHKVPDNTHGATKGAAEEDSMNAPEFAIAVRGVTHQAVDCKQIFCTSLYMLPLSFYLQASAGYFFTMGNEALSNQKRRR